VKLDFEQTIGNTSYSFISDDTSALDAQTLFLKTAQNTPYYEKLDPKPASITSEELIAFWMRSLPFKGHEVCSPRRSVSKIRV